MKSILFSLLTILALSGAVSAEPRPADPGEGTKRIIGAANPEFNKTSDFGGSLSQSFALPQPSRLTAVRLLIECRENPRDLLILIREADEHGYPMGPILSSGLARIVPWEKGKPSWHDVILDEPCSLDAKRGYTIELHPSKPHGGFGYFEYAYSIGNLFPAGRLHIRDHGRSVPDDQGWDLCFKLLIEVPRSAAGDPVIALPRGPGAQKIKPSNQSTQPNPGAPQPDSQELARLLKFLRWHHLNLDNHEGTKVDIWAEGGKLKRSELLVSETIEFAEYDIYYGVSIEGSRTIPIFHTISGAGGGGTSFLHGVAETHWYPDPLSKAITGKPVLIGKGYAHGARIWLRLTKP